MAKWETIKIPEDMMKKFDKFIESEIAKDYGITNRSTAVVRAMSDFLAKYRHFSFYLKSEKHGKTKFVKKGPFILCAKCNSQVCKHAVDLLKHKKLFDFDSLDDGDVLAGVDFDRKIDITNPQKI